MQTEEAKKGAEHQLPTWLDECFLSTVLQGGEEVDEPVTIIDWSAIPAVAAGNNYTSHLYRVSVKYRAGLNTERITSLIVKVPFEQGFIKDIPGDFYSTEPFVYRELLPIMCKRTNTQLAPESFYCPVKGGLVLQDLKTEGYVMCDRFKQLDFQHCSKIIETLAKFHAASVDIYHLNPDLVEQVGKDKMFSDDAPFVEIVKPLLEFCTSQFIKTIKQEDIHESLSSYISSISEPQYIFEKLKEIAKRKTDSLNVLTHADCWTANMLFKHNDTGDVADAKLIDFQIMRYTTPVLDLLHVVWTSANEEARERMQELFDVYLQHLNQTLEDLECVERLTYDELQEQLRSATDWVFLLVSYVVPFVLSDPDNIMNMEDLDIESIKQGETNEHFSKSHHGKYYRSILPSLLRDFEKWLLLYRT